MELSLIIRPAIIYSIVAIAVAIIIYRMRHAYRALPAKLDRPKKKAPRGKAFWILLASMAVVVVLMSLLIWTRWVHDDEWRNIMIAHLGIDIRILSIIKQYLIWVSRFGDVIISLFGESLSKIETSIMTAIMLACAPLFLFRLCCRNGDSVLSGKGLVFYWFAFILCITGVALHPWRNYSAWEAVTNYFIPTLLILYFLYYYRTDHVQDPSSKRLCITRGNNNQTW